ncbi:MAG TPA: DUF1552 domain-containing protein [Kofleriaceae bacterium]|nr:DUF1552 domain-containing protein [Kofleriaceae bacterium]
MAVKPLVLSRRALLRGMAGGALISVALPPLEAMLNRHGEALSGGEPLPVRFGTFFFGNGVLWDRWIPTAVGETWEAPEQLQPLVDRGVKENCSVLTGFENKLKFKITHHEGAAGMLSGHPFEYLGGLESKFGGPSIDQVIASALDTGHVPGSIQLGVSKRVSTDEDTTMRYISHRSTTEPLPPTYSPAQVWRDLFGSFVPPDDPTGPARIRVLDAVRADARRLEGKLGMADRHRLAAHLEGVDSLEALIRQLPPVCERPLEETLENTDANGQEPMELVAEAMSQLLVYTWACDMTRVASYMLTGGVGHTVYGHLGQSDEQHAMSHDPKGFDAQLNETIVWNVDQFARLCQLLKEREEGGSNLLNNSILLLCSDCGEGWSHTTFDQPIVVAGGGAGQLVQPGIHYRSARAENTSDILLTLAQAMVPSITEIGSAEGLSNTPFTEILI